MRLPEIEKALSDLPAPEPPADLEARCLDTIPAEAVHTRRRLRPSGVSRHWRRWAVAGAALAFLAIALLLPHGTPDVLASTMRALAQVRTVHWVGRQSLSGKLQPMELWLARPSHTARRLGTHLTLDDGRVRLSYSLGTGIAYARTSYLGRGAFRGLTGASLLNRIVGEYRGKPGVTTSTTEETTADGRRMKIIEFVDSNRWTRGRARVRIDTATDLLVGLEVYEWREGQYVLSSTVDKVEYNVPIADAMPQLPPGVKVVPVDNERRATQRLVSVTTPKGNEVVVRTVDIAENGDVYIQLARGLLLMPASPSARKHGMLTDDGGRSYRLLPYNVFWRDGLYVIFRPSTPRQAGEPLPRRFTLRGIAEFGYSLVVKDATKEETVVTLEDIPAPRQTFSGVPPFEPFIDLWNWNPE
jgi:hypothetical protein